MIIDSDIAPFEELNYTTVRTMKKLLYVISQSVPFTPNVSKLSTKLQVARNTILRLFDILDKAQLISLLHASTKGITFLQKPEQSIEYILDYYNNRIGSNTRGLEYQSSLKQFMEAKPQLAEQILDKIENIVQKLVEKGMSRHSIVQAIIHDYIICQKDI